MSSRNSFSSNQDTAIATIANGQTVSDAVSLAGHKLVAVVTPAALTGTTLTFQASADGVNFVALHNDDGNAVSITVAASRYTNVPVAEFRAAQWLKVVSNSAEAAERKITLVTQA